MTRAIAGQVQTVLGAIAPETMGVTLPHEHLLIDFSVMFAEPTAASDKGRAAEPVSLANLGWVRQNFNANLDNLRLTDEQVAIDEIRLFQRAGGATVVDPTPLSLARDPLALARIARATGLAHRDGVRLLRRGVPPARHGHEDRRRPGPRDDRRREHGRG